MIVDANILVYARDADSPHHKEAASWLEGALGGSVRIGLPWESLTAFLRLVTNPRSAANPLSAEEAVAQVEAWMGAPAAWIPVPTNRHAAVFTDLVRRHRRGGNVIPDAHLAALAICHGVGVCSADSDFARFGELRWFNPVG